MAIELFRQKNFLLVRYAIGFLIDLLLINLKKLLNSSLLRKYLEFNKIKPLLKIANFNLDNLKSIKKGKFQIKNLELEFDENFKLKTDFTVKGDINQTNIKISDKSTDELRKENAKK